MFPLESLFDHLRREISDLASLSFLLPAEGPGLALRSRVVRCDAKSQSRAASLLDLSNLPGRDQWSGTEIDPIQLLFWVRIQLQMVDHVGRATRAHGPRQGEMTCLKRGEEFHPRIHPLTTTSAESSVEERSRLCSGAMSPTGGSTEYRTLANPALLATLLLFLAALAATTTLCTDDKSNLTIIIMWAFLINQ